MMKDIKHIVIFVGLGLLLAYALSGPLRKTDANAPQLGTRIHENIYVKGTVTLSPALSSQIDKTPFLFVIARVAGQAGGPPLAVKRYDRPTYPFYFNLTEQDNMVRPDFYAGDITVTIRLDADGLAMPKQPADVEKVVEVGSAEREVRVTF